MRQEQVALAWARAARVSTDEMQLAAWQNAVDAGLMRSRIEDPYTCRTFRLLLSRSTAREFSLQSPPCSPQVV